MASNNSLFPSPCVLDLSYLVQPMLDKHDIFIDVLHPVVVQRVLRHLLPDIHHHHRAVVVQVGHVGAGQDDGDGAKQDRLPGAETVPPIARRRHDISRLLHSRGKLCRRHRFEVQMIAQMN